MSDFLQQIIFFLPKLFVAILVLVIAAAVAAAVKDLLGNALGGLSYGAMLAQAASLFVIAIGVFAALDQLEIAPLIVGGIYYGLLALIIVPLIIAFGVGGIEPAREAIRSVQAKAAPEAAEVAAQATAPSAAPPAVPADPATGVLAPPTRVRKATGAPRRRSSSPLE